MEEEAIEAIIKRALHEFNIDMSNSKANRDKVFKSVLRRALKSKNRLIKSDVSNLRTEAHKRIDFFWQSGLIERGEIYKRLQKFFNRDFHFSNATKEECQMVIITDWLKFFN